MVEPISGRHRATVAVDRRVPTSLLLLALVALVALAVVAAVLWVSLS